MTSRNIYIVEDDEGVRQSLQKAFCLIPNLLVWGFPTGDAFLERVDELDPGCVLLDFNLPGSNGIEVLRKSVDQPKFAFVMLTGHGQVAVAVQAMKAGATDFLEKPCDFPLLMDAVENAFGQLESSNVQDGPAKEAADKLALLSARELEVLQGLVAGDANKIIAHRLGISPRTVEIHRANMTEKLGARSLSEALRIAFLGGVSPLSDA